MKKVTMPVLAFVILSVSAICNANTRMVNTTRYPVSFGFGRVWASTLRDRRVPPESEITISHAATLDRVTAAYEESPNVWKGRTVTGSWGPAQTVTVSTRTNTETGEVVLVLDIEAPLNKSTGNVLDAFTATEAQLSQ